MAAYQNSTCYFASSNLTTQPECSAVCASFQPAAATSEEPQAVSSAQIFEWDNFVCQRRTVSGSPANVLPSLALCGPKDGANELHCWRYCMGHAYRTIDTSEKSNRFPASSVDGSVDAKILHTFSRK